MIGAELIYPIAASYDCVTGPILLRMYACGYAKPQSTDELACKY